MSKARAIDVARPSPSDFALQNEASKMNREVAAATFADDAGARRARLSRMFSPRSVALVGASERSMWSIGIWKRFNEYEFPGRVFAVNKTGANAHGYPGFTSCVDIGETVDLAYIFVPLDAVLGALQDVARAGIKSVIILTSGFSEVGEEGARLQERVLALAKEHEITVLGPNSLGFANVAQRLVTTIVPARLPIIDGAIGFVSQSGAVTGEVTRFAYQQGIGFSFLAATGNEAEIGIANVVDYLVDDPATRVIAVFSETIGNPRLFSEAARRALACRKPIVIYKVGKSEVSAQIARAHTGSLVGDDKVFDAACRQLGIIRVSSIEELVVTASLLENTGPLEKPGVGLVSISGGACGMFADRADEQGINVPALHADTLDALANVLPPSATALNPLDITGATIRDPSLWEQVLPVLSRDPSIGLLLVVNMLPGSAEEVPSQLEQARAIGRAAAQSAVPVLMLSQSIQPVTPALRGFARDTGLPALTFGIDHSTRALGHLARWSRRVSMAVSLSPGDEFDTRGRSQPHALHSGRPKSERDVLDLLSGFGVPVIPALTAVSAQAALEHARKLGGRVVLKIASPDIAHKTEVGGVRLDIEGDEEVSAAFDAIQSAVHAKCPDAKIDGILVSPMRRGGVELFVGTAHDPHWGPMIAVGVGGIWVEALADTALRPLPVSRGDVLDMLGSLRAARILQGFRGAPPVDIEATADAIVKIGRAALAFGDELVSLEINPLMAYADRVEALDGLMVWADDERV
jgi:acetate---CoA ligase (ADP-forming)